LERGCCFEELLASSQHGCVKGQAVGFHRERRFSSEVALSSNLRAGTKYRASVRIVSVLPAVALIAIQWAGCGGDSANDSTSVSVPDRPAQSTVARLKPCFSAKGLQVFAGSGEWTGSGPRPIEVGATDGEGGPGALMAVYDSARLAAQNLPSIKDNLQPASGQGLKTAVEQHGSVTLIWIPDPPADSTRSAVLGCLGS
jgi:hypothetical protein